MPSRKIILMLFGVLALAAMLLAAGCGGDDSKTATTAQCDPKAPSLIPPTQGRPQLVEFFRDT